MTGEMFCFRKVHVIPLKGEKKLQTAPTKEELGSPYGVLF